MLSDMAAGHGHEHGHEHGHGHGKMELPDYRQWKIEGTPLETVQKKLAARGLRDPWARNEAWRGVLRRGVWEPRKEPLEVKL